MCFIGMKRFRVNFLFLWIKSNLTFNLTYEPEPYQCLFTSCGVPSPSRYILHHNCHISYLASRLTNFPLSIPNNLSCLPNMLVLHLANKASKYSMVKVFNWCPIGFSRWTPSLTLRPCLLPWSQVRSWDLICKGVSSLQNWVSVQKNRSFQLIGLEEYQHDV